MKNKDLSICNSEIDKSNFKNLEVDVKDKTKDSEEKTLSKEFLFAKFINKPREKVQWSNEETDKLLELYEKYPRQWAIILQEGKGVFNTKRNRYDLCSKYRVITKNNYYPKAPIRKWEIWQELDEENKRVIDCKIPATAAKLYMKKIQHQLEPNTSTIIVIKNVEEDGKLIYYRIVKDENGKMTIRRENLLWKRQNEIEK